MQRRLRWGSPQVPTLCAPGFCSRCCAPDGMFINHRYERAYSCQAYLAAAGARLGCKAASPNEDPLSRTTTRSLPESIKRQLLAAPVLKHDRLGTASQAKRQWHQVANAPGGKIWSRCSPQLCQQCLNMCTQRLGAAGIPGLERLSGGSGWRGYLYTFTSPAPARSRPAAYAQPDHGRRLG